MKRYIKFATVNPMEEDLSDKAVIARETSDVNLIYQLYDYMKSINNGWDLGYALLDNPNTPDDIVDDLLSTTYYVRQYATTGTLPDRLRYIADRFINDANIKSHIALNPNTPSDTLEYFLSNKKLVGYVLMNPGLSKELIESYAHNGDSYTRSCIVFNPSISPTLLTEMANDPDEEIRSGVACNSNTPIDVLERLSNDESGGVRLAAKSTLQELSEL